MRKPTKAEALKLPDQLLVRYYRAGEIDGVTAVDAAQAGSIAVTVKLHGESKRVDRWRDLGGGLGFVPDAG